MPLLLLMGLGGCIESWEPLRQALSGRELILVDHPGMGRSPAPSFPIPMPGLALLYDRLLAAMGYGQVDVLGYSFGGAVGQQLAFQHPGRVRRIVLAATTCGWGGIPPTVPAMMAAATTLRYYSRAFHESIAPYMYAGRTGREPGWLGTEGAPRPSAQGLLCQVAAYATWTSLPWLHLLRQAALVLAGEEDPMTPLPNSVLLARRIPGATLHVFPHGGHLFLFDETPAVVRLVDSFLGGAAPGRSAA
jgi:pimeloyl-ACP methyl ester carboxylesterase